MVKKKRTTSKKPLQIIAHSTPLTGEAIVVQSESKGNPDKVTEVMRITGETPSGKKKTVYIADTSNLNSKKLPKTAKIMQSKGEVIHKFPKISPSLRRGLG